MIDEFVSMKSDLDMLKTAFGNMIKVGPVHEVDAAKGYRMKLGEDDGEPFLSPWLPHPETGKSSIPLKVGQTVGILSPSGDMPQGVLIRAGYSANNDTPNQNMQANVFEDAGVRIEIKDGKLIIQIGGVSWELSGDGFYQVGGRQDHDGRNVGSDHLHEEVVKGSDLTGVPVP